MLLALAILLLLFWVGGFAFSAVGDVIHLLLVLALISIVLHYFTGYGRRGGPVV
jgi:NADH:ubiquinone oxidoreductase subunit 2 (subunit N)